MPDSPPNNDLRAQRLALIADLEAMQIQMRSLRARVQLGDPEAEREGRELVKVLQPHAAAIMAAIAKRPRTK